MFGLFPCTASSRSPCPAGMAATGKRSGDDTNHPIRVKAAFLAFFHHLSRARKVTEISRRNLRTHCRPAAAAFRRVKSLRQRPVPRTSHEGHLRALASTRIGRQIVVDITNRRPFASRAIFPTASPVIRADFSTVNSTQLDLSVGSVVRVAGGCKEFNGGWVIINLIEIIV